MEALLPPWTLQISFIVFGIAALLTIAGCIQLTLAGQVLASRTGWGDALFGSIFFGLATSLSGIVITVVSAIDDQPQLAYSNAVGGISAQTMAIAIADIFYRRGNLEHAAASLTNLLLGCLLIGMLSIALVATFTPDLQLLGVHPASLALLAFYLGGLMLIKRNGEAPMWRPVRTPTTHPESDAAGQTDCHGTPWLWAVFLLLALGVSLGGWAVSNAGQSIVEESGLRAGFVGAVMMGLINALPETVTSVVAVKRGATALAISMIIGGNSLDVLNLAIGDLAYRGGSLYHAAGNDELLVTTLSLLMTAMLLAGLLIRQAKGWGSIGFEGVLMLSIYALGVLMLYF
ncbi:sodium:calcium antiporter [Halotalea alkalilenta]|uniref:sodium:calcium antiporter n=1 Tax=Halotalea alkalilenta TaxID=376489 RepID=UPI000486C957|nr:cation transporter [Halotalea alkalilenta]